MPTLSEIQARINDVADNLIDIAGDAVRETKEDYLQLQAKQLEAGQDSTTNAITLDGKTNYSKDYEKLKLRSGVGIGALVDRITLYKSGDFYKSLSLSVRGNDIYIYSGLYYIGYVTKRTANDPLGIGGEYKAEYVNGPFAESLIGKIIEQL